MALICLDLSRTTLCLGDIYSVGLVYKALRESRTMHYFNNVEPVAEGVYNRGRSRSLELEGYNKIRIT